MPEVQQQQNPISLPDSNSELDVSAWPRVTAILKATGIADFSGIPNIEYYLQRGTDVHQACADVIDGMPDYWSETEIGGYVVAWQAFLRDTQFKPRMIELPVYNQQRRYRGTLDYLGTFGDSPDLSLLDLKSGIVAEWVRLQTAAYAACLPEPQKIKRYGVQLKKDGSYNVSPEYKDFRADSNAFFSLVGAVHARALYGKTMVED